MPERTAVHGEFGSRFSQARDAAALTQSALASPRYTVSYVSQIESGRRMPSPEALAYFAGRLGVSVHYLQTGIPDGLHERLSYRLEEGRAFLRGGDAERALELAQQVRAESESYGMAETLAQAHVLAGDALGIIGRAREAIDRYEEALERGLTQRDQGQVIAALASTYRSVGDLSYAISLIESELKAIDDVPLDPSLNAELLSVLLSLYFERGDITRAERVADQALAAASDGASPRSRANVLWAASRVFAEAKRWDDALALARDARLLIERLDDQFRLARVHTANAFICLEADPPRLQQAGHHLATAVGILEPSGPPHELAFVYMEQGRLALLSGRPDHALERAQAAVANAAEDPLQLASCRFLRGRALAELSRYAEALDDFHEAAAVFEKTGARQQLASCWREVGEVHLARGDTDAVVDAFREGLEALDPRRSRA
jgi:tetratricopeptide (TPR) repeat protein